MPVYLDEVPADAEKIARPLTLRWVICLFIILAVGTTLVLWQWTGERSGFVFWFTALGLPFCFWGLLFSFRRIGYKIEQNGEAGWNYECGVIENDEISRGKRFAWILDSYVQTQAGRGVGSLLAAIEQGIPLMNTVKPRVGNIAVRHSRLTEFDGNPDALEEALNKAAIRVKNILEQLPETLECWVMFECDAGLSEQEEATLLHLMVLKSKRSLHRLSVSGPASVDYWLDRYWRKPSVLVVLTVSLRPTPKENDAEAITALVFCNRKSHRFPNAVRLHRPQQSRNETLTHNMMHSLRWAEIQPKGIKGIWMTGEAVTSLPGLNQACEDNKATLSLTEDIKNIDDVLGFPGKASFWAAIALASEVVQESGVQFIAAHSDPRNDDIWLATITAKGRQKEVIRE
nr:PrgI family protein [Pantoea sp. 201603H]